MFKREWPLVANTLLVQLAAGMFIFLALGRFILAGQTSVETAVQLTGPGMNLVGPIILLAMLLSLFHLGNPFRAYRSINNLGSSWLSREVIFSGLFFVLWLICFLVDRSGTAHPLLIVLTALAGLMNVISMANIYYSTPKKGWDSGQTYLGFLGSTVILGSAGSIVLMSRGGIDSALNTLLGGFILVVILVLIIQVIGLVFFVSNIKIEEESGMDALVSSSRVDYQLIERYRTWSLSGWIFSLVGAGLICFVLYGGQIGGGAITALCLVLIGELLGRGAFFLLGFEN